MRRIPYPAWRLLMECLRDDATFVYCICPRFTSGGLIEVLLLLNVVPPLSIQPRRHQVFLTQQMEQQFMGTNTGTASKEFFNRDFAFCSRQLSLAAQTREFWMFPGAASLKELFT